MKRKTENKKRILKCCFLKFKIPNSKPPNIKEKIVFGP